MYSVSINDRVDSIKKNQIEINKFVEEYKPFIAACVEKATGRYVRYGEDDELSIALMAFVEAINAYDKTKGSFLSFAQNVIKRRIIDYYRKEQKHSNVISIAEYTLDNDEDGTELDLSYQQSIQNYTDKELSEYRRLEIEELKNELSKWDISFLELSEVSPKAVKTRTAYRDIVSYILSNSEMVEFIKLKKYLPVAEIQKATGIPRKKIERARKYLLAVLIIYTGDYQYIKDYLDII